MGSTEKMGTGLNVQDKLLALHNLDAPWRPADLTQRNGRILRPVSYTHLDVYKRQGQQYQRVWYLNAGYSLAS